MPCQMTWQSATEAPRLLDVLTAAAKNRRSGAEPPEENKRVAARLRLLRQEVGHPHRPGQALPVEDAAHRAGLKPRQWQRYEAAENFPSRKSLGKITTAYEIDVSELTAAPKDEPAVEAGPETPPIEDRLSRIERQLAEINQKLEEPTGLDREDLAKMFAKMQAILDRLDPDTG